MKLLVQRVKNASCVVDGEIVGKIRRGVVAYVGFTHEDTCDDIKYLSNKLLNLRIFDDEKGVMNLSLKQKNYQVLSISQFTLYADTKKGNRPSYSKAMNPNEAKKLYDKWNETLRNIGLSVETGLFGTHMEILQVGDGPVSILLSTKYTK